MIEDANFLAVSFPSLSTSKPNKGKAVKKRSAKVEDKLRDPEAMTLCQKVQFYTQ